MKNVTHQANVTSHTRQGYTSLGTYLVIKSRWVVGSPTPWGCREMLLLVVSHIQRISCQPEKTTLHGGQSRSWSAEQGKKKKKEKGTHSKKCKLYTCKSKIHNCFTVPGTVCIQYKTVAYCKAALGCRVIDPPLPPPPAFQADRGPAESGIFV